MFNEEDVKKMKLEEEMEEFGKLKLQIAINKVLS